MELVAVAAVAENNVIGRDTEIPWDLPEDKRQYRARIADDPVILGRRTFEWMLDDLPGRAQIVLSRSRPEYDIPTASIASSVEEAISIAERHEAPVAYVIGGAAIYALFQPHLDRMILTRVPGTYEGDAYYPEWEQDEWILAEETEYENFTIEEWVRNS